MVSPNSNVRLTYENGCSVVLEQEGIYTLPEQPACDGHAHATHYAIGAAVIVGVGAGIYFATKPKPASP